MPYKKISGIYCIENKINDKKYIGQSIDIKSRWSKHKKELKLNTHHNQYLQSSWNKYGEENFIFYIILECDRCELNEFEIRYIDEFSSCNSNFGYNLTKGGDKQVEYTNEVLNKISDSSTKYPVLQFTLDGVLVNKYKNCNMAANDLDLEAKRLYQCCQSNKRYKTAYGYIWIYEQNYNKDYFNLEHYKKNPFTKAVIQYDKEGNFIEKYDSGVNASYKTSINIKSIYKVCRGERNSIYGYIFKFAS